MLLPQSFFAFTFKIPPVLLAVTLMLLVEELPVQPEGSVQT